jgi:hypothetical protein
MKSVVLALALTIPLAALAAAPAAPGGPAPGDREQRREQMEKRMRLARTLGLAEALDLSEPEALRLREVLARIDAKREPLKKQLRESMEVVKKAAQGDPAAEKGVDEALRRLRELRGQMMALHDEAFQAIAKDLPPQKKAKAALFLARFRERMGMKAGEARMKFREMRMQGPMDGGRGGGPGGPGGPGGMGGMGGRGGLPRLGAGPGPVPGMDADGPGPGLPPLAELSDEDPPDEDDGL